MTEYSDIRITHPHTHTQPKHHWKSFTKNIITITLSLIPNRLVITNVLYLNTPILVESKLETFTCSIVHTWRVSTIRHQLRFGWQTISPGLLATCPHGYRKRHNCVVSHTRLYRRCWCARKCDKRADEY